jgi:hypothetical protein
MPKKNQLILTIGFGHGLSVDIPVDEIVVAREKL